MKYELCQAEDEKDEAVKSAIDQQNEKISTLKTTIVELENQLKELQATSTNENIEAIRDKLASQNIELASLRVELKRAEGDKQTANKKAHAEIDMERAQVILLLLVIVRNSLRTQPISLLKLFLLYQLNSTGN